MMKSSLLSQTARRMSPVTILGLLIISCTYTTIVPAAHAQFISDATGMINRFDIHTGIHTFEIAITSNFDITDVRFDSAEKRITMQTGSTLSNNIAEIVMSSDLLAGDMMFHLNGIPQNFTNNSNDKFTFLVLRFDGPDPAGNTIDIMGTETAVAESAVLMPHANDAVQASQPIPTTRDDTDTNNHTTRNNEEGEGGGCLIATAAFGSETEHSVQLLREIRDGKLASTEYGRAFLDVFNNIYYSFSPQVADYQRENPFFREAVRLSISPMLSSLTLLDGAETDLEILMYGTGLIALNLGLYVAAPVASILYAASRMHIRTDTQA